MTDQAELKPMAVCIGCGGDIPTSEVEIVADSEGRTYARCTDDRACADRWAGQPDEVRKLLRRNANRRPPGELVPVKTAR